MGLEIAPIKGRVHSLHVSSNHKDARMLELVLKDSMQTKPLVAHEDVKPGMLAAMASVLQTAMVLKAPITVGVEPREGDTDYVNWVELIAP